MNEAVQATEAIFNITISGITYTLRLADELVRHKERSSMDNAAFRRKLGVQLYTQNEEVSR